MAKALSEMSLEELWELFPIQLTAYQKEWTEWYKDEYEILSKLMKTIEGVKINHIGSTAIGYIWAKPIVDILVEVPIKRALKDVKELLINNGYLCMSESDTRISFNKGYTKDGFAERVFHIHIRLDGDHDEFYFRDYMKERPDLAKQYEKLKLSLWKKYEHNRDAYTEAKTEMIKAYTKEAKALYGDKYELDDPDGNVIEITGK